MFCNARVARQALLVWGLVALADFCFFGVRVGWMIGTFALAAALAYMAARWGRWRHAAWGSAMTLAIAGLATALWIDFSDLALLLLLALLALLPLCEQGGWSDHPPIWLCRGLALLRRQAAALFIDIGRARDARRRRLGSASLNLSLGIAWIVPLVLSLAFFLLFALGNPLIGRSLSDGLEWLGGQLNIPRAIFWGFVFYIAWGYLRGRLPQALAAAPAPDESPRAAGEPRAFGMPVAVVPSLALFNAVFALQSVLDLVYLWGGAALPRGMSYAEYAHRGAYPLIATALLAGLFVLATFGEGRAAERDVRARALVFAWLAQNVLLVASSLWRLHLYVDVYSLTRLRLAAGVWMGLVALGLCLIAWRIAHRRSNAWLLRVNAAAAFAVLYCSSFVDTRGFIAQHNLAHAREFGGDGPQLDLDYLATLGHAALPALLEAHNLSEPHNTSRQRLRCVVMRLRADLAERQADWRTATLRGARILNSTPSAL